MSEKSPIPGEEANRPGGPAYIYDLQAYTDAWKKQHGPDVPLPPPGEWPESPTVIARYPDGTSRPIGVDPYIGEEGL